MSSHRQQRLHIRLALAIATVLILAVACDGADGPVISEARVGAPTGPNAGLYFTVESYGTEDALLSASTDVAGTVELHETVMGDDGTMGMRPVTSYSLPATGELVLEPGGLHIMLMDVDRLEAGTTIEVTLTWEKAGEVPITANVVEPAETGH